MVCGGGGRNGHCGLSESIVGGGGLFVSSKDCGSQYEGPRAHGAG